MIRRVLNNTQWERVAPLPPGKAGDPGRTAADNRRFLEAVLWIVRVGAPWRDLPDPLGNWNSAFKRFRRWTQKGLFERPFQAVIRGPRLRICDHRRNHHPCPSTWRRRKRGPQNQAIGRPRGGLTTKIVALVNALGNLARFVLLPGQRHDSEFIRFLNAVQRAVPAGKVIHATADNYATHKHPNVLRWLADHPRWDLPFHADLGVVAQCRRRNLLDHHPQKNPPRRLQIRRRSRRDHQPIYQGPQQNVKTVRMDRLSAGDLQKARANP